MAALAFLLLLFFGSWHQPELSIRHMPTVAVSVTPKGNFSQYQKATEATILKHHWMINGKNKTLAKELTPFTLKPAANCAHGTGKPYKRGILLTHGLTDSVYTLKPIAEFFQSQCFYVQTILLPGMSTRPGDLLSIQWQDWVQAEQYGTDQLLQNVEEPYLLGYSIGASLALIQATEQPVFKGIFLMSPAIAIDPVAAYANWSPVLAWYDPRFSWLDIEPDDDPYKYSSFPFNAAYQTSLLLGQLQKQSTIGLQQIPLFMVLSDDDKTVNPEASLAYFIRMGNSKNRGVLYTRGKRPLPDQILQVPSSLSDKKILSLGHLGLILPPNHPKYGEKGSYASCAHYYPSNIDAYTQCKDFKEDYVGETTQENLAKGVIRRITFNPFYDDLLKQMKLFLESTYEKPIPPEPLQ